MDALRPGLHGNAQGDGARRWFVLLGCFIGMGVAMPAILPEPMTMVTIFARTGSYHAGPLFSRSPLLALGLLWLARVTPRPVAAPATGTR